MENIDIKLVLDEIFCEQNVSDDEIYAELKRRKANKSVK